MIINNQSKLIKILSLVVIFSILLMSSAFAADTITVSNLCTENFEDSVADGFAAVSGTWSIINDTTNVYRTLSTDSLSRAVQSADTAANCSIQTNVKVNAWSHATYKTAGILARYSDPNNYYLLGYDEGSLVIKSKVAGVKTVLVSKPYTFNLDTTYTFKAVFMAKTIRLYVNDVLELQVRDSAFSSGKAGLISVFGDTRFDDFVVDYAFMRPDPTNTGYTGTLTNINGYTVTTDGAVIENVNITGQMDIKANNVTIRNFKSTTNTYFNIRNNYGYTGLVIEDGELTGALAAAVVGNVTARRIYVYEQYQDAFKPYSNSTIESCYITQLGKDPTAHADGIQISGAASNIMIQGNCINTPTGDPSHVSNATVFIKPDFGNINGVTTQYNWLNGGGISIYSIDYSSYTTTNSLIQFNRFGPDYYYSARRINSATTFVNNVWDATGEPCL